MFDKYNDEAIFSRETNFGNTLNQGDVIFSMHDYFLTSGGYFVRCFHRFANSGPHIHSKIQVNSLVILQI